MKILFSPVGGTDPISNFRDGAFLHICRYYKPDKVIFYMSKEICSYHEKDQRYTYCLEKLEEKLGHKFEYYIIKDPDFTEAHDFDKCMDRFTKILSDIKSKDDDTIYLNVSSGTPAMKAALILKSVVSLGKFIPIQVSTPERRMNNSIEDRKNYEAAEQWDANEDNEDGTENRCTQIRSIAWLWEIQRENIKAHISSYNYIAAYDILNKINEIDVSEAKKYLSAASDRLKLNIKKIREKHKALYDSWIPVKENDDKLNMVEYTLAMGIKIKKHEYADFIRAISPILLDLYEIIIKVIYDININNYVSYNGKNMRKWDLEKIKGDTVLNSVITKDDFPFYKDIGNGNLYKLIEKLNNEATINKKASPDIYDKIKKLHDVEKIMRNPAAHEIVSITDENIEKETGINSAKIFDNIKSLINEFVLKDEKDKKNIWDSYEKMNKKIISKLEGINYTEK